MVTASKVYAAGLYVMRNSMYNSCRWLTVIDDFGNLVKVNEDQLRTSLKV
jgi:hypothetical protein